MNFFFIYLLAFIFGPLAAVAQSTPEIDSGDNLTSQEGLQDPSEKTPLETSVKTSKGEWIFAPVPKYGPSQGWGLALVTQYILKGSNEAKPSIISGAIFETQKKSYGGFFLYVGRLNEDRLRLNVQAGYAKMNIDFYGVGKSQADRDQPILLSQDFNFLALQLMPKWGPVYIGPTLNYIDVIGHFGIEGMGLKLQADTRDNTFYPLAGYLTNVTAQFYDENFSRRRQFQLYGANHNIYSSLPNDQVLASRLNVQFAEGDVPSFFLPTFGLRGDMRGYKPGKFRDRYLWDVGTEYRHRFTDRWGVVAFASAGDLMPSPSDFSLTDLLWSGGVGLRFRIARENPVYFRVDLARGDNQWLSYFSVNQAY